MLYWLLKHIVLGPLLALIYRPDVRGRQHIPAQGAVIFASNHHSFSDHLFLPLVVDRHVTFLAKKDYFTNPGLKGWLQKQFFSGVGQIPVDRSGGRASEAALEEALKVLGRGELLGIYPEGTRSPDGRLYRGRTGVARMALQAKVPVIPVAMVGTDKALPENESMLKYARISVRFGEPLDFSRYQGMEEDRRVLRSITDEIMDKIMELSGQEYVDVYASTVKDQIKAERARRNRD